MSLFSMLISEPSIFYGTRRFVTTFTSACYWVNLVASHTDVEVLRTSTPHVVFSIKPIAIFAANFENIISHRYVSEWSDSSQL
jgi:hypothetical protein